MPTPAMLACSARDLRVKNAFDAFAPGEPARVLELADRLNFELPVIGDPVQPVGDRLELGDLSEITQGARRMLQASLNISGVEQNQRPRLSRLASMTVSGLSGDLQR